MSVLDPDRTLADLVTEQPGRAAVLERLGLDYCCGGRRPLATAVSERGLVLADVIAAFDVLDAAAEPTPLEWAELDLTGLADHLEASHHAYLHEALPRLDALATKVAHVHGQRHPELHEVRRLVTELRADLEPHLRKEEQVLFPMIRELARAASAPRFHCGSVRNPIGVMEAEHDRTGALLVSLRSVTRSYFVPADGCASYRALYRGLAELEADTHLHVHKENNALFPRVIAAEQALPDPPA